MTIALAPPMALLAELTHRCPLACPYCSNPLQLVAKQHELTAEDWSMALDQAAAMGVLQVHFSGGEPMIRADLPTLIAKAHQLGLYTNLITSGMITDHARLTACVQSGLDHVQLSIQDSDPINADRIAKFPGSLARKQAFAQAVSQHQIALTINAVIHRHNAERVPAMIDFAVSCQAQRIEIAHTQYYGWGLLNRAALMPSRSQLEETKQAVEHARRRLDGLIAIDFVIPDYYGRYPKACMDGWGRRFINIAPNGLVLPCQAAQTITGMQFENIREHPLAKIWQDSDAFNRYRGTQWMPPQCQQCEHREIDWGGCRCQAFAISANPDAIDPACQFSPDHARLVALAEQESSATAPSWHYRTQRALHLVQVDSDHPQSSPTGE